MKIDAMVQDKVQERSLWGWRPNATRRQGAEINHSVVLVGARDEWLGSKKIEHIYYIDPNDPSDPENVESQRIYVMSLGSFRDRIFNLAAQQMRSLRTNEVTFEVAKDGAPNNYAVYDDTKVNYL